MKVAVLSHMFPRTAEDWNGIFVQEQVGALRRAGVDARAIVGNPVWVPWRKGKAALRTIADHCRTPARLTWTGIGEVPTAFFRYLAPPAKLWGPLGSLGYRRGLRRYMRQLRRDFPFDLVHCHTAFLDGNAGAALARRFHIPFVLTEHTGPFSTLTRNPFMRRQTETAINRADLVLAVSEFLRAEILREVIVMRPECVSVLGNGFRPEIFYAAAPPGAGERVRALWIGGFMPVKQPLMLINAFAEAYRREPRLTLTLVGQGELEKEMRERVAMRGLGDVARFCPSASRETIARHMREHHFAVVSSEIETFSLVALEALACGRPVLTTRCGGPQELVGDASRGEIVENSVEGLADGFVRLAGRLGQFDPEILHGYACANFGFDVIAARLKLAYENLLEQKAPVPECR